MRVPGHRPEQRTLRGHLASQPAGTTRGDRGEADRPTARLFKVHLQPGDGKDLSGLLEARVEPVEALVVMVPLDAVQVRVAQLIVTYEVRTNIHLDRNLGSNSKQK